MDYVAANLKLEAIRQQLEEAVWKKTRSPDMSAVKAKYGTQTTAKKSGPRLPTQIKMKSVLHKSESKPRKMKLGLKKPKQEASGEKKPSKLGSLVRAAKWAMKGPNSGEKESPKFWVPGALHKSKTFHKALGHLGIELGKADGE